jgi:hypothetical protein
MPHSAEQVPELNDAYALANRTSADANGQMLPITIALGDGSRFTITPQSPNASFSFELVGGNPVIRLSNEAIPSRPGPLPKRQSQRQP